MITVDSSSLNKGIAELMSKIPEFGKKALSDVASEIMRLSSREVPHDTGMLQNSGQIEPDGDGYIVGYHTDYAARLHEHPEYNFHKGRKGKYLEDPIKNNTHIFLEIFGNSLKGVF